MSAPHETAIFWQHPRAVTVPNDLWTPLPWNSLISNLQGKWSSYVPAATTIAVGSNGLTLPQATVHVASTLKANGDPAFTNSGFLVVRIGGTDRVVQYTGRTSTSFTGCTFGVGPAMTTGDIVEQANVLFKAPYRALTAAIAEVAWASNAVGLRGIRFNGFPATAFTIGGTTVVGAVAAANPLMHIQTTEQPGFSEAAFGQVEVYQSSGAGLDSLVSNLAAPRLVAVTVSSLSALQ